MHPPRAAALAPESASFVPLTDLGAVDALGADLRAAGYDATAVPALLGEPVHRALGRGNYAAALWTTRGREDPLAVLTRLFLLGSSEPAGPVAEAFPHLGVDAAVAAGVLTVDGGGLRAAVDVRPHADQDTDYLVVSDLDADVRGGPVRRDHVLGVGAASISLARAVIRDPVDRALDLGTGCGIQALHASTHASSVVATDTNPRALVFAAATARLAGRAWDLREGSLFEPIAGEQFDLVISNPPFVVGPGTRDYLYRDSGVAADGLCEAIVRDAPAHLTPGGTAQLLANWVIREGTDWRDRLGEWLAGSGCDAWIVQREAADPVEYVELWLADAGERAPDRARAAATWLDYLAAERVEAIGMGLISLHRTDADDPLVTLDELPEAGAPLTGPEVGAFLAAQRWVRGRSDADLLATRLVLAPGAVLEQRALAGHEGWDTVLRLLRRPGGPGAVLQLDEWGQALLGGCTGAIPLGLQIELLGAAHQVDPAALAGAVLPSVRVGVLRGLLQPAV